MKKDNRPYWVIVTSSIVSMIVLLIQLLTDND
jgi:hypothetical protein